MAEKEYIERQAAFNALLNLAPKVDGDGYCWVIRGDAAAAIDALPTADLRPVRRGKWTLNKDGSGTCSECGFVQNSCWDLDNWDNFCHHCGADMRPEPPKEG